MKTQALFTALSLSALLIGNAVAQNPKQCDAAGCSVAITYTAKITESTCRVTSNQPVSTELTTITIDNFPTARGGETDIGQQPLRIALECPAQWGIKGYVTQTGANSNNSTDILVPTEGEATGAGFRLYYNNKKITLGEANKFPIRPERAGGTYNEQESYTFQLMARYVNRTGIISPGRLMAEGILHLSYH